MRTRRNPIGDAEFSKKLNKELSDILGLLHVTFCDDEIATRRLEHIRDKIEHLVQLSGEWDYKRRLRGW